LVFILYEIGNMELEVERRLGERGQLTIPKKIREDIGLNSGDHVIVRCKSEEGKATLELIPAKIVPKEAEE